MAEATRAVPTTSSLAAPLRLGVVVAVRNEGRWIEALLSSLKSQDGLERVCCIAAVDGRSDDGSRSIMETWKNRLSALRVLENEARIAPTGFNIGIRACLEAGAEAVLIVSGHSFLHAGFLEGVQAVLTQTDAAVVGCVLDYPAPAAGFEKASQAFAESRLGRRMGAYSRLTRVEDTEIATFPAIRREVFARIGLFDESMIRNQDIEFTSRARSAGFRVVTAPQLRCRYSPPATFGHLVRQMYGNGVWVGRRLSVHGVRHVAPAAFVSSVLLTSLLALTVGGPWGPIAGGLVGAYLASLLFASLAWTPRIGREALWLPPLFLSAHVAYAVGTFEGLIVRK